MSSKIELLIDEIEAYINGLEISKQMKYKLRKQYLCLDFNDVV